MPTITRHLQHSMPLQMFEVITESSLKVVGTHTTLWHKNHMQWCRQPEIAKLSVLLQLAVRR